MDPASPAARRCLARFFAELAARFAEGLDPALAVAAEADAMRPPTGAFLVAVVDGEPVACGAVTTVAPGVGSLKRMWVADGARGMGLGRRMLAALEEEGRTLGISVLRLETNRALVEAIGMYRAAGYVEVEPFSDERYAEYWFEKRIG